MKRFLITLLCIVPLLTGCASIDANLSINKDKSAQLDFQMISDNSARPQELYTMESNAKKILSGSGYEIKDQSGNDGVKFYAQKKVKNLLKEDMDLTSLGFITKLPSGNFIDVKHNFFITLYNIDMIYNLKSQQDKIELGGKENISSNGGLKPEYLQKYEGNINVKSDDLPQSDFLENVDPSVFIGKSVNIAKNKENAAKDNYKLFDLNNLDAKFTISLPSQASSSNAQIVNGSTYTWELSKTSPTEIHLVYVVYSGFAISLVLLFGIGLIIYLAYRIYRHETLKRIGNNN